MNIGFDIMGGDLAPQEAVAGLAAYLKEASEGTIIYVLGPDSQISPLLEQYGISGHTQIRLIHAPEVIGYHEHPARALKEKQQSSIAIGFHLLATGKTQAFISAGNTGAMLVGTMYTIKPIDGVSRPTVATIVPKINGSTGVLCDVGLNVDCKPEHLSQFALLGSLYSEYVLGVSSPRVGLLNVGEEETKGNLLAQQTFPLLRDHEQIQFIGNIEGRDLFAADKADVYVCDGFTGNIVLKMAESIYDVAAVQGVGDNEFFNRFHYENYGGTPILGVSKPVVLGHGVSKARAFHKMILVAEKMIQTRLCEKIQAAFSTQNSSVS